MNALIATHLWQSTLCAGIVALVAWVVRANHARVRHLLWLLASLKFLVPFSLLAAIGRQFEWHGSGALPDSAIAVIAAVARPFVLRELQGGEILSASPPPATALALPTIALGLWIAGALLVCGVWLFRWRAFRRSLRAATPLTEGREVGILQRVSHASGFPTVPMLASPLSVAPSVVGCLRPVILWPSALGDRMNDDQIAAILLHELAHVRRRDNLAALIHMVVSAGFWFHPATWWIGARLEAERERACDEEVVRLGADPHQYAESILLACEYAAESPLPCVTGVTGADLKRRVVAIACRQHPAPLGRLKRALVATLALVFAVGPIAAGAITGALESRESANVVRATGQNTESTSMTLSTRTRSGLLTAGAFVAALTALDAQAPAPRPSQDATTTAQAAPGLQFEVASIKRAKPDSSGMMMVRIGAAGNTYTHTGPIRLMIQQAYQIPAVRLLGGPDWLRSDSYDISARIPEGVERIPANTTAMARALLADRFKLVAHDEQRDMPIYELVYARPDKRLGPNLKPVVVDCAATPTPEECRGTMTLGRGTFQMRNAGVDRIVSQLESIVGRPIVDRTGLTGRYSVDSMSYGTDQAIAAGTTDLPSIFTVVQEQLGLKLEAQRGPVKVVVIDSIQRPTED